MQDPQATDNNPVENPYEFQWKKDYEEDWFIHRQFVQTFDAYEAMGTGQVFDSVSTSTQGSRITDSYTLTLARERANRVMGKLPDGVTQAMGKADEGKAAFMDILRQKWIFPNANAQAPFQSKLEMWQLFSDMYGYMPMFYDWNVSPTGYVGPDCWLWNPRNLIPQQGRNSIADMEYVTALTWVNKSWLEDRKNGVTDSDGWNTDALNMLIERATNETTRPDAQRDTYTQRTRVPAAVKRGICLATRYEAGDDGEWITFAPDHGYLEVRRIKNPHKNGRIPFVIKYSQRLYDSFYGLGYFQLAKPLQFARDGLTNFYFTGIKNQLIPPLVANANGVLKHTLDYRPGGVILETIANSVRTLEVPSAGLNTYEAAQQALTGSLLSLYGSQNASLPGSDALNPSMGKTPAAISLYGDKEATADGAARNYLEQAIEELTDGFFSLIVKIGTETIPVNLFRDDIQDIISSGLGDVKDLFKGMKLSAGGTIGQLTIDPKQLQGVEYRFNISAGSTTKDNKAAQLQSLTDWIATIGKLQNVIQSDPTVKVHWDNIMEAYDGLTDIPGSSQFITFDKQATPQSQPVQVGSQVHEVADLVKLYQVAENNPGLQAQILQSMGFQPTPNQPPPAEQPDPNAINTGHVFQDPQVAAAADAFTQHVANRQPPEPQQEPALNVTSHGHAFQDPTLAKVAENVLKSSQKSPPLKEPSNGQQSGAGKRNPGR